MKIKVEFDYSSEKRGVMKPSFRTGAHEKGERRKRTRGAIRTSEIKYFS